MSALISYICPSFPVIKMAEGVEQGPVEDSRDDLCEAVLDVVDAVSANEDEESSAALPDLDEEDFASAAASLNSSDESDFDYESAMEEDSSNKESVDHISSSESTECPTRSVSNGDSNQANDDDAVSERDAPNIFTQTKAIILALSGRLLQLCSSEDEIKERGHWTGKLDFRLSCLGFAVGKRHQAI